MPNDHTLAELEALSGLPARTIRYYIGQGLLPSPGREGPATRYPETTLHRLRLIARLRDAHLPLAEIRARLAGLDDAAVASLAASALVPAPVAQDSALDYVRRLLGDADRLASGQQAPLAAQAPLALRLPPDLAGLVPGTGQALRPVDVPPTAADRARAVTPTPAASLGERSQWERIAITTDIELHVRRPLTRTDNRLVERLLAFARQLQEGTK